MERRLNLPAVAAMALRRMSMVLMLTAALFLSLEASATASVRRPHIILIIADDMGWNDAGVHGQQLAPTPHLDALALAGRRVARHYTLPTCTPSRAALLTGRHPAAFGMQGFPLRAGEPRGLPLSEGPLLPSRLRRLGYATRLVGKWHLGAHRAAFLPTRRGFDAHFGYRNGYVGYFDHAIAQALPSGQSLAGRDLWRDEAPAEGSGGEYLTHALTREAVRVIRAHAAQAQRRPLFLQLAHLAVHAGSDASPLEVPDAAAAHRRFAFERSVPRRLYAEMLSQLDGSVGAVLAALRDARMLNDSVVVALSDNGGMPRGLHANAASNWPLRGAKHTLFEGGVRTFAAVWSSRLRAPGEPYPHVLHVSDWAPTLLAAAAVDPADPAAADPATVDPSGPSDPVEPAAADPSDPVDPAAAADPSDPVDPINSIDLNGPIDPNDRINPSDSINPAAAGPINPCETIDSIDPNDAVDPVNPAHPAGDPFAGVNHWEALIAAAGEAGAAPRTDALLNVDDVLGHSAVLSGRWKYVEGSHEGGIYDGHSGDAARGAGYPPYDAAATVEAALSLGLSADLSLQDVLRGRAAAAVDCGGAQDSLRGTPPCAAGCLFDLREDPCELRDLSARRPALLQRLRAALGALRAQQAQQLNAPVDPRADPKRHGGVWAPWLDPPAAPCSQAPAQMANVEADTIQLKETQPHVHYEHFLGSQSVCAASDAECRPNGERSCPPDLLATRRWHAQEDALGPPTPITRDGSDSDEDEAAS